MIIVDRIAGEYAVCEQPGRTMVQIPLSQLPPGLQEGDCLREQDGGGYRIDREETDRRRKAAADLLRSLLKKD